MDLRQLRIVDALNGGVNQLVAALLVDQTHCGRSANATGAGGFDTKLTMQTGGALSAVELSLAEGEMEGEGFSGRGRFSEDWSNECGCSRKACNHSGHWGFLMGSHGF